MAAQTETRATLSRRLQRKRKKEAGDSSPSPVSYESPIKKAKKLQPNEKRLRRFRASPPQSFHQIYVRATSQRFFVLSRRTLGSDSEEVKLAGSTGNLYTVTIVEQPTCDCPHFLKGNQCKHVVYVLARVLRARFEHVYQLALLPSELSEIFANAPRPASASETVGRNNRKPIEGDCPICFNDLNENAEAIVYCKAACGQNLHQECFEVWAKTKRQGNVKVTCPYCRTFWEDDGKLPGDIDTRGKVNDEGYVNLASQLGLSTERDTSTYSQWWSGHISSYRRRM